MASVLSTATRRTPQQDRSEVRLAKFLKVASELIEEVGFEAMTMTAIAERSGTSIGGLYHYFPDKKAVAFALLTQSTQEMEVRWQSVFEQASTLPVSEFVEVVVGQMIHIMESRPAYLLLLAEQISFSRDPAARQKLRMALARAFQAKNESLSDDRAFLIANVAVEIVKGLKNQFVGVPPERKPAVAAEFKRALGLYLGDALG